MHLLQHSNEPGLKCELIIVDRGAAAAANVALENCHMADSVGVERTEVVTASFCCLEKD